MSERKKRKEEAFKEAEQEWNLSSLYADLLSVKQRYSSHNTRRKYLTSVEKCYLRGLLRYKNTKQIADVVGSKEGTVKEKLSEAGGLYDYIEILIREKTNEEIIRRWDIIPNYFEKAGYKRETQEYSQAKGSDSFLSSPSVSEQPQQDQPICPYLGLSAFREKDAAYFFGRERFTEELSKTVEEKPLVAVIGASGSGKSSVVFAGLIPRLRREKNWVIVSCRLGNLPFDSLSAALIPKMKLQISEIEQLSEVKKLAEKFRQGELGLQDVGELILQKNSDACRLLLVIDQFEELYTLCKSAEERQRFLDELVIAVQVASHQRTPNLTLVITLRADFYGYALSYRPFSDALQGAVANISSMSRQELKDAIEKPATQASLQFEDGLTQRILKDVSKAPGNLPLLEFTLTQLWEKRRDGKLTHSIYEEIGGVEQALAQYAEEVYRKLKEDEQKRAKQIFVQLVRPGEGTADTRRLATRHQVGEDNWDLVTRLADARLVVSSRDEATGEETVEVVHEALIEGWQRLREWMELESEREFRTWQERLRFRMAQWKLSGKDKGELLRGASLVEAEKWLEEQRDCIPEDEQAFIQASRECQEQELQRWKRLSEEKEQQRQEAERQRMIALAHQLAAQSEMLRRISSDLLVRSVLLAVESLRRFPTLEGAQALRGGLALLPRPVVCMEEDEFECVFAVAFSSGGNYLATVDEYDRIRIWDVASEQEVSCIQSAKTIVSQPKLNRADEAVVNAVAFSPDGKLLATASQNHTARVWDIATQQYISLPHGGHVNAVAFSSDGTLLATASQDHTARIWDIASRQYISLPHGGNVNAVAFSPDGTLLATVSQDHTARIWDIATSQQVVARNYQGCVSAVIFSPDGKCLATESLESNIYVWEVFSEQQVSCLTHKCLTQMPHPVALVFSPNGKYLATADDGRYPFTASWSVNLFEVIHIWDLSSSSQVCRITHPTVAVAFSSDEKYTATVGLDCPSRRVWDITVGQEVINLTHKDGVAPAIYFSPSGELIATICKGQAQLWNTTTGQSVARLAHENVITFSPDWKYLVTESQGQVCVWEASSGRQVESVAHEKNILDVVFSSDGRYLATASEDKTVYVQVWQVNTGSEVRCFPQESDVFAIALSPTGKYLAVVEENLTHVWQISSMQKVICLEYERDVSMAVAFSPDENYLAVGSYDGTVEVWQIGGWCKVTSITHDRDVIDIGKSVESVAFSPDGKYLATASADRTARVWDIAGKREVARMTHEDCVWAVDFSPGGTYIATRSSGTARVWLWKPEDLIAEACSRLTRNLYEEEWQQYLGDEPYHNTCPHLP